MRRILRIWPLYLTALLLVFGLSRSIGGVSPVSLKVLLANLFLMSNWPLFFSLKSALPLGFSVLWSLGIEEQFYLLWPSISLRLSRRALLVLCVAIWLVAQIVTAYLWFHSAPYNRAWFNTFVQMQYFALGGALSLVLRGRLPRISAPVRGSLVLLGLVLFCVFPRSEGSVTVLPYQVAGVATICIMLGMLGASLPRWTEPLRYWGKISYGLYVLHFPIIVLTVYVVMDVLHRSHGLLMAKFLFSIPLTLLAAHLSYRYLERPFLTIKERFEVVRSRVA